MILIVTDSLVYIKKHFKPVNNKHVWEGKINYLSSDKVEIINRYSQKHVDVEPNRFCNIMVMQKDSIYGYSVDAESHTIRLLLKYNEKDVTVQFDNQAEYDAGVENVKGIFFV
jgi:hypothetical protein